LGKLPELGQEENDGELEVQELKVPVMQEIKNKKFLRALEETSKG
jgi:hypothetical protein